MKFTVETGQKGQSDTKEEIERPNRHAVESEFVGANPDLTWNALSFSDGIVGIGKDKVIVIKKK